MKKAIFIILCLVLAGVMVVCGVKIYQGLHAYDVVEEYYETAQQYVVIPSQAPAPEATPVPVPEDSQVSVAEPGSIVEESIVEEEAETVPFVIDFDALLADCPDTVGWLYAPDGSVNLPLVQGDDNSFYLDHLPTGEYSFGGSLFMDYLNSSDFSDEVTYIYGHNMKNGTMLQPILDYRSQDYYNKNPFMYVMTPKQNYKLEVFAGVLTGAESDVYEFQFDTPEVKQSFIDGLVSRSTFTPWRVPAAEERILCLSTCAYDYENARYVVFGALTPVGGAAGA